MAGTVYNINSKQPKIRSHEYVIGDVHGCFKEFKQLVNKILEVDSKAQFILIGDIVDRGGETVKMLEWAMKHVNREHSRFKMILGNHEHMKIEYFTHYLNLKKNGTITSVDDIMPDKYNLMGRLQYEKYTDEQIEEVLEFFKSLPIYYETYSMLKQANGKTKKQHFIIVHGDLNSSFINKDESFSKSCLFRTNRSYYKMCYGKTPVEMIVWDRNYFGHSDLKHTIIIHGHTPTVLHELTCRGAIEGRIDYKENDINVDCGIAYDMYSRHANLAAISLDDLKEIYLYDERLSDNTICADEYYRKHMTGESKPKRK